jgi:hypothetical protein
MNQLAARGKSESHCLEDTLIQQTPRRNDLNYSISAELIYSGKKLKSHPKRHSFQR